ncbi:uncharacterized protein LOC130590366 [Beta vulgaris subsp. vulgaris]|uniref:uncharacterized protein LOC130590366 n=1 Tax=Beta vulgaris subsp. vulgaris TaxID=3555 RepID=UPI002548076B|nr:uncharacterized protein LOC130590366 [Beta vulgaris subsp. vulgaris]
MEASASHAGNDFHTKDAEHVVFPHDDPLVVTLRISNCLVHRILVDGGSSANILYLSTFEKLMIGREYLKPVRYPVIGFTGASVTPEGLVSLPVRIGDGNEVRDVMTEFLVVDVPGAYNAIVGRPLIHDVQGIVSTYHLTMLYVTNEGTTAKLRGNQEAAKSCYLTTLKQPARRMPVEEANPPGRKQRRAQRRAVMNEQEEKESEKDKEEMMEISMEELEARPEDTPRPKPDGKLSKKCWRKIRRGRWLRDRYRSGGYHQISLLGADRKKTAFITDCGVYNYKAMPFGLRNAGATYQKLVDKVFAIREAET